ncbi:MAG: hypothetical protein KF752_16720 [Pirellulaceae bacterium]|nr:hypothetical protein [Pirellulaceae bacterium]
MLQPPGLAVSPGDAIRQVVIQSPEVRRITVPEIHSSDRYLVIHLTPPDQAGLADFRFLAQVRALRAVGVIL